MEGQGQGTRAGTGTRKGNPARKEEKKARQTNKKTLSAEFVLTLPWPDFPLMISGAMYSMVPQNE